jgi:hypothetical protein
LSDQATPEDARNCPWCAAPVTADAGQCPACGAAVAQRESIGDLAIPGLTAVHPALEDFDKRPLHLTGPSPSQGMAPALIVGAMAGGPAGLAAIGGVAAAVAVEYLGAGRGGAGGTPVEDVGKPSEVVLRALEQLDAPGPGDQPAAIDPTAAASAGNAGADDDGRSVWRDLPEGAGAAVAGTEPRRLPPVDLDAIQEQDEEDQGG